MKIAAVFVVIGILFSYTPVIQMDECPGDNHRGNMKLDCGYTFHCPLISDGNPQESLPLPLSGRLVSPSALPKVDELTRLVFHPHEN